MNLGEIDYRRYYSPILLSVSLAALVLLGASYFVEVRVIVENPNYGDVTGLVQLFWRALLGGTTIGSFLIGVYTLVSGDDDSDGPPTKVEIKGTGHDIDVYPGGPVGGQDDGGEAVAETTNDASSVASDEKSESEPDGEKATG